MGGRGRSISRVARRFVGPWPDDPRPCTIQLEQEAGAKLVGICLCLRPACAVCAS